VSSDQLQRLVPALAGHYEFERELGHGAFATVFLARDLRHERPVAIKVLRVDPSTELNQIRFLREIRFLAGLQHPNIVPVHDSGHVEGLLYYVMPYVRGESLRDRLNRERRLRIADAVRLTGEIADALDYAHGAGVIHRDIKPENILLSGAHPMLADFGIARAITSARGSNITRTGFGSPGTPAYMSPEQLAGERDLDGRTDIYSLGCVLYEMLAGEAPFAGEGGFGRRFSETPPSARAVRQETPPALDQTLAKALAQTPEERFQTAAEMAEALSQAEARAAAPPASVPSDATVPTLQHETLVNQPPSTLNNRRAVGSDQGAKSKVVRRRAAWVGIAALVLAIGAPRAIGFFQRPSTTTGALDPRRIAVLEFEDQSADRSLGHIASGLTVSLIHELSGIPAIQVLSRNSVRALNDRAVGLDSLVAALRVGSLVEGSVQRSNDRLRVTVQLVDGRSRTHLESATIERRMGELFLLEDDLAHEVALLLRRRIGVELRVREAVAGTRSARARELVFRADKIRDDAAVAASSADTIELARTIARLFVADSLLAAAEDADRRWIAPVIERGWVALELAQRRSGTPRVEAFRRATEHANRALARERGNAAALELRGTALYWQAARLAMGDRQFSDRLTRAEEDLKRAVSIDSSRATAWGTLSLVRVARGDVAEAEREAQTALAMDTYLRDAPTILLALYGANLMKGSVTDAWKWCNRGGRDYPRDPRFIECRLTLLAEDASRAPDPRLAWNLVAEANEIDPPARARAGGRAFLPIYREMMAAVVSARAGDAESARAVAHRARSSVSADADVRIDLLYDEAYLHLVLGERNEAIRLLSDYLAARPSLRGLVSRHPRWRPIWSDSAFTRLTRAATPGRK
jgi:eukaryotic-like serine/threonine-protein kinase